MTNIPLNEDGTPDYDAILRYPIPTITAGFIKAVRNAALEEAAKVADEEIKKAILHPTMMEIPNVGIAIRERIKQ